MRRFQVCLSAALVVAAAIVMQGQPSSTTRVKALVGGTLVDGFAGPPIQNSVILIDGDKISAVGQVGTLAVPAGAEVISTEGMTVLPGLWDMHVHTMIVGHADYDHWDKAYVVAVRVGDHAGRREAAADGRRHQRARSRRAARGRASPFATASTPARFPAPRSTSPVRSSSTSRIRTPRPIAGASRDRTMGARR